MLRVGMRAASALLLVALAGCDLLDGAGVAPDAAVDADGDAGYLPPRHDLVPAVGSATTLDLACWNIENFPDTAATPAFVADLITSLDLDLVVVEEIASVAAWNELLARLPEHDGVLSRHAYTPTSYQKIGLIYRTGLVTVGEPELLFVTDSYGFPRPPFRVPITVGPRHLDVIGVHLKAGVDAADADRRAAAARSLDAYLRGRVEAGDPTDVMVMGDYNEQVISTDGAQVLGPLIAADAYRVRTRAAAEAGAASFLPSGKVIDQIVTTAGLDPWFGDRAAVFPPLDREFPGYQDVISDHLPAVLTVPMP